MIEYKVVAELDGRTRTLFTTGIRVSETLDSPVIQLAEDLTWVDPEALERLLIIDLDFSIAQRWQEMFKRILKQRKRK